MGIATINPATGETLKTFTPLTTAELDAKLAEADRAFQSYRHIPITQRAEWMRAAADVLEANREPLGKIMTLEMGKPIKAAIAAVEKCALVCRFYAERAAEFLADVAAQTDASQSFVRYQPLGAILAVMPWNFLFWQVFRFAAPALMAGNAGVLKHASNVPRSALHIEEIFRDAGFPRGLFASALVGSRAVPGMIADGRIVAVTLTGSEPAGMQVAERAGHELKKTVLELGGSDPFIVLADADVATAAKVAAEARLINSGQSCICAKRFIVVEPVAEAFLSRMVEEMRTRKMGDPLQRDTQVGPQ